MKKFKSFKMSETTFNQINSLPEKLRLKYYAAVCQYGINGIEPEFSGVEYSIWIPMKDLIDYSNDRKKIAAANGKKGGRPPKADEPNLFDESDEIKSMVQGVGYFLDGSIAKKFSDCGLPSEWMSGTHTFFEFVAERILANYGDKPYGEQKALFITAVRSWDDLRDEYPEWKVRKDNADRKRNAINSHPTHCEKCGTELSEYMGGYKCMNCYEQYDFNEKLLEWRKST